MTTAWRFGGRHAPCLFGCPFEVSPAIPAVDCDVERIRLVRQVPRDSQWHYLHCRPLEELITAKLPNFKVISGVGVGLEAILFACKDSDDAILSCALISHIAFSLHARVKHSVSLASLGELMDSVIHESAVYSPRVRALIRRLGRSATGLPSG